MANLLQTLPYEIRLQIYSYLDIYTLTTSFDRDHPNTICFQTTHDGFDRNIHSMLNPIVFEVPPIYNVSRWFRQDLLALSRGKTLRIVISLDHGGRNLCCGSGDRCHEHWSRTEHKFVKGAVDHATARHFNQLAPFLSAFAKFEFQFANAMPCASDCLRQYNQPGFPLTDYDRILSQLRRSAIPLGSISLTWHREAMDVLEGQTTGSTRARRRRLRAERTALRTGRNYLDWRLGDTDGVLAQLVAPLRQLRCQEVRVQMPAGVETPAYVRIVEAEMKSERPIVDLEWLFSKVRAFEEKFTEAMYYLPFAVEPCLGRTWHHLPCRYCPSEKHGLEHVSTQWKGDRPDLQREGKAACIGQLARQSEFWNASQFCVRAVAMLNETGRVVRLIRADEEMHGAADVVIKRWLDESIVQAETIQMIVEAECARYVDWQDRNTADAKLGDASHLTETLGVAIDECLTGRV